MKKKENPVRVVYIFSFVLRFIGVYLHYFPIYFFSESFIRGTGRRDNEREYYFCLSHDVHVTDYVKFLNTHLFLDKSETRSKIYLFMSVNLNFIDKSESQCKFQGCYVYLTRIKKSFRVQSLPLFVRVLMQALIGF